MRLTRTVARPGVPPPAGFPRWAWWTVLLATFTFAVPLASPWWSTPLRSEIPDTAEDAPEDQGDAAERGTEGASAPVPSSTLRVTLRMKLADGPGLGTVEREIPYLRGVAPQIQAVVSELATASTGVSALLPEGTRVLDVAFTRDGLVFLDFSPELDIGRSHGQDEETVLVGGIVATVIANFAAVRRVIILVDGKAAKTYHLDLTRPLHPDDPAFAEASEPEAQDSGPIR